MKWKLEVLWGLALGALAVSLAIGDIWGGGLRLILGFAGSAGVIGYIVLKGIDSQAPRFLERKRILAVILLIITLGVIVASMGGFYNILGQSNSFAIDLEIAGTAIFVFGVLGFVLTLAIGPHSKIP